MVCPNSPAVVWPARTESAPMYKPHSSAALEVKMMKPTKTERARVRRKAVPKAWAVEVVNRSDSRCSAV